MMQLFLSVVLTATLLCAVAGDSFEQIKAFPRTYFDAASVSSSYPGTPFVLRGKYELAAVGESGSCIVALSSDDNSLYSAGKKEDYNKLSLDDPWGMYEAFWAADDGQIIRKIIPTSTSTLLVVTDTNVVALELSPDACGKVVSQKTVLQEDVKFWSAGVGALAASTDRLWVSPRGSNQVYQVMLSTGAVVVVDYAADMASNVLRGEVASMAFVQSWRQLYVSTETVFYMLDVPADAAAVPVHSNHEWVTGVLDMAPVDMAFDPNHGEHLWLVQPGSLHRMDKQQRFDRFGYHQGAPVVTNLTSVGVTPSAVYVGSAYGVVSLRLPATSIQDDTLRLSTVTAAGDGCSPVAKRGAAAGSMAKSSRPWEWNTLSGNRYTADNAVVAMSVALSADTTTAFTIAVQSAVGVSMLDVRPWTLAEKSEALAPAQERHEHNGLTANNDLKSYGDSRYYDVTVTDNDGLWTSMHVMGETYCFMVTGDQACRKRAMRGFVGLEGLSNVTGAYPNFPARSWCDPKSDTYGCGWSDGKDRWHYSPNPQFEGMMFKDDTSSDEIDGHLAVYPMVYDMLATSDDERARAYALIDGITGGLIENDLNLIDPTTGKVTTWGFWGPEQLNGNPDHYSERGTNALGIMAYLVSAYSITGRQVYMDTFYELADKYNYLYSVLNVKIDNPDDDNHSDNELISMTYHIAFWAVKRFSFHDVAARMSAEERAREPAVRAMVELLVPGAQRTWGIISGEFDPFFTAVYTGLGDLETPDVYVERAEWMLRSQPLDLITWPSDFTWRVDLETTPFHARDHDDAGEVRQVVPLSERPARRMNGDPFALVQGNGMSEMEPAVYRLPYYMMKYFGLLGTESD